MLEKKNIASVGKNSGTGCHAGTKPAKRRNNEKRKEKSRDAARTRRSRETEIFTELGDMLPLLKEDVDQLDKASVMRLAIAYLKVREMVDAVCVKSEVPEMDVKPIKSEMIKDSEKMLIDALDGFLIVLSEDGDITYSTENITDFLGLQQIDILAQPIWDYSHQCDHEELRNVLTQKRNKDDPTGKNVDLFLRLKCTLTSRGRSVNIKSASYKVIHLTGHVVVNEEKNKKRLIAIGRPIPHPSNIEVPLGSNMLFLTKHSLDMKFTYVDEKMSTLLDYSAEDLMGKSLFDYHHGMDSEYLATAFKCLLSKGQVETKKYRFLGCRGGYAWIVTQATIVYDKQKPQSVVCVNYVISGIEHENEIYSNAQLEAQSLTKENAKELQHIVSELSAAIDSNVVIAVGRKTASNSSGSNKCGSEVNSVGGVVKRGSSSSTAAALSARAATTTEIPEAVAIAKNKSSKVLQRKNVTIVEPPKVVECHSNNNNTIIIEQHQKSDKSGITNCGIPPPNAVGVNSNAGIGFVLSVNRPRSVTDALFAAAPDVSSSLTVNSEDDISGEEDQDDEHIQQRIDAAQQPESLTAVPIGENKLYLEDVEPLIHDEPIPPPKAGVLSTEDMSKGILLFPEVDPDLIMLKEEPDDLIHLAPTPGDACIVLDESSPFLSSYDEFKDLIDNYFLQDDINAFDAAVAATCDNTATAVSQQPLKQHSRETTIIVDNNQQHNMIGLNRMNEAKATNGNLMQQAQHIGHEPGLTYTHGLAMQIDLNSSSENSQSCSPSNSLDTELSYIINQSSSAASPSSSSLSSMTSVSVAGCIDRVNIDPFINYRDESSDTSGTPHLLSPSGSSSKSPDGSSSLPSLCSPNGSSFPDDDLAFMTTITVEDEMDLSMRAPYISMSEADDLPLLISEDLMWGALPEGMKLGKNGITEMTLADLKSQLQQHALNFNIVNTNANGGSNHNKDALLGSSSLLSLLATNNSQVAAASRRVASNVVDNVSAAAASTEVIVNDNGDNAHEMIGQIFDTNKNCDSESAVTATDLQSWPYTEFIQLDAQAALSLGDMTDAVYQPIDEPIVGSASQTLEAMSERKPSTPIKFKGQEPKMNCEQLSTLLLSCSNKRSLAQSNSEQELATMQDNNHPKRIKCDTKTSSPQLLQQLMTSATGTNTHVSTLKARNGSNCNSQNATATNHQHNNNNVNGRRTSAWTNNGLVESAKVMVNANNIHNDNSSNSSCSSTNNNNNKRSASKQQQLQQQSSSDSVLMNLLTPLHIDASSPGGHDSIYNGNVADGKLIISPLGLSMDSTTYNVLRANPLICGDRHQLTPNSNDSSYMETSTTMAAYMNTANVNVGNVAPNKLPLLSMDFDGRFISDEVDMDTPDASFFQDLEFNFV